jgi:TonB family protein
MKHLPDIYAIVAFAMLSVVIANAQTGGSATKHFEKDGLAFDYPDGWELTDSTSQGVRTVTLAWKGSVAQIVVNVQGGLTPNCDFLSERKKIAAAVTEKVANRIGAEPARRALPVTAQTGGSDVEGTQLQGLVNGEPVTGAVYSTRLNQHYVSLIYIAAANDEPAKTAWNAVRKTFTVAPSVLSVMATTADGSSATAISSGVLNGRALALPRPDYPNIARSAHAAGTVTVQVTIDEAGNVIAAHAVSGHPLLQAACVAAAREAKFSPTKLCGEPVRVAGIITYNFVA